MRIRKRQVPLPLSSLSPIPLSDPHVLINLHTHADHPPITTDSYSPPHPPPLAQPYNTEFDGDFSGKEGLEENKTSDNATRKGRMSVPETSSGFFAKSTSSFSVGRWWSEGEKVVPLKKRRGDWKGEMERGKVKKMKTKMNKKCGEEGDSSSRKKTVTKKKNKKGRRGGGGEGGLLEGSRCSRVNGRGWRCCEQTLVGYSLCEHHLGKGRMRSINTNANANAVGGVEKKEKPLMRNKRMKIGMVKARSMSSLLGQPNNKLELSSPNKL